MRLQLPAHPLHPLAETGAGRVQGAYEVLLEPGDRGVLGADPAEELPHVRVLLFQVGEEAGVLAAVVELQRVAERQAVLPQLQPERGPPAAALRLLAREVPYEGQLRPQPAVHVEQLPGDPALPGDHLVRAAELDDGKHPAGALLVLPVPGLRADDVREQLVTPRPFGGDGDGLVLLGAGLDLYEGPREQVVVPGGMPIGPGGGRDDEQPAVLADEPERDGVRLPGPGSGGGEQDQLGPCEGPADVAGVRPELFDDGVIER
ncbi:hypothetical protein ADK51_06295 [Streptomyces sp. WM6368]|nr:hypothetical protein ADK51_06295 [Streptomyces sp. WM6368]